jgi:CRISPR-associated protein Csb2
MLTIAFTFPGHRYHATPWGNHVNEGLVEWPPSPWRILRAFIAVGFSKLYWNTLPDEYESLIRKLAKDHPWYGLPPVSPGHTRHYMPAPVETAKIFDVFLRIEDSAPLVVVYPDTNLDDNQAELLDNLLKNMAYLGRAESWVEARLAPELSPEVLDHEEWCGPTTEPPPPDYELTHLVSPWTPEKYVRWRADKVEHALKKAVDEVTAKKKKAPTPKAQEKLRAKVSLPYPETIVDCLMQDTGVFRKQGWSQPPGSERITYLRRADALEPRPLRALPPMNRQESRVEVALLALSPDTIRGTMRPRMTRVLPQTELLHQAIVSRMEDMGLDIPALRGTDATGRPLSGHRHVHFIPLSLAENDRMDHMVVYAPDGLDSDARRVLQNIRRTWAKGIKADIVVTCVGFGSREQLAGQIRTRSGRQLAEFGNACRWHSLTPLVLPRFIKRKGRHTPEAQIREHLVSAGFPPPVSIQLVESKEEKVQRGFFRYVRSRGNGKPRPPSTRPWLVELEFPEPVRGPVSAGYGSHFGLGLFEASLATS